MANDLMKIKVDGLDEAAEWSKTLTERMRLGIAHTTARLAQLYINDLKALIPNDEQYKNYRNSLSLFRSESASPSYGVFVNLSKTKVQKVDAKNQVLFITPLRKYKGKKIPRVIQVLVQFNPWTVDTLPLIPDKRYAESVVRMVGENAVNKVRSARKKDQKRWEAKLSRAGVSVKGKTAIFGPSTRVVGDAEHIGAALEFGYGSRTPSPHWRPALKKLASVRLNQVLKEPHILRTLTDPKYPDWKKPPPKQGIILTLKEIGQFSEFAKKVLTALH